MAKELELQPVETDADGRPMLGYIVPKSDFDAFQQELNRVLGGQPVMMGTLEEGDLIKIKVWGLSLQAAQQISDALANQFNVQSRPKAVEEPNLLSFDISLKKPKD